MQIVSVSHAEDPSLAPALADRDDYSATFAFRLDVVGDRGRRLALAEIAGIVGVEHGSARQGAAAKQHPEARDGADPPAGYADRQREPCRGPLARPGPGRPRRLQRHLRVPSPLPASSR
jgi:hypothetical protein